MGKKPQLNLTMIRQIVISLPWVCNQHIHLLLLSLSVVCQAIFLEKISRFVNQASLLRFKGQLTLLKLLRAIFYRDEIKGINQNLPGY